MITCSECKHWALASSNTFGAEFNDWTATEIGFGKCKAIRARWAVQDEAAIVGLHTSSEGFLAIRRDALKAARAYVQDGSEYHAELVTGATFSCALAERKP